MANRPKPYTFSMLRMLIYVFLGVITSGAALIIAAPFEVYRWSKAQSQR